MKEPNTEIKLKKRTIEPNYLYGISQIITEDLLLNEKLQKITDYIPQGWQYPEITCAQVTYRGQNFKTSNFKETSWKQSAEIKIFSDVIGTVNVFYLEEMPIVDDGPFCKEERNILDTIAENVLKIITYEEQEEELKAWYQISNIFLTVTDDEMYANVLNIVLKTMNSKYGIFGYVNSKMELVCPSMTKDIWEKCKMEKKDIVYPRETWGGIWGRALIEKKTLYSNKPFNVPEGHIQITRALTIPIIYKEAVIGNISVANKETDYNERDVYLLETIAKQISPVLNARLNIQEEEKKRKETEFNLRERVKELKCLYGISEIIDENLPIDKTIQKITELIPQGYQFSEIAKSRIIFNDNSFVSKDFEESDWKIESHSCLDESIKVDVKVEVFYTENKSFLPEEIELLNALSGRIGRFLGRKESEKLKIIVEQNKILMKELLHRVKNNFSMIISMLSLQKSNFNDALVKSYFDSAISRLHSMLNIHEILYRANSYDSINICDFIAKLIEVVDFKNNIEILNKADNVLLPTKIAVPCGLLINELLTNSIKYAFPDNKPGKIEIHLTNNNKNEYKLLIADNGIGLPDNFNITKLDSLGMMLINALVQQIRGELNCNGTNGAEFSIQFKLEQSDY